VLQGVPAGRVVLCFWHGSRVEAGKKCDYIWFEMCIEGYPGEIK